MAAKRAIMRIQLDASAKNELDRLCEKRGMTQIAVMSRLVGWFIRQDEVIQTAVMESLSDSAMSQLARQLLKRLSTDRPTRGKDQNSDAWRQFITPRDHADRALPRSQAGSDRSVRPPGHDPGRLPSRIIEWFTTQSDVVQAAILGLYPKDIRSQLAEMILRQMASEKKKG